MHTYIYIYIYIYVCVYVCVCVCVCVCVYARSRMRNFHYYKSKDSNLLRRHVCECLQVKNTSGKTCMLMLHHSTKLDVPSFNDLLSTSNRKTKSQEMLLDCHMFLKFTKEK